MSIDYKNLRKNLKNIKFDNLLSTIKSGLITEHDVNIPALLEAQIGGKKSRKSKQKNKKSFKKSKNKKSFKKSKKKKSVKKSKNKKSFKKSKKKKSVKKSKTKTSKYMTKKKCQSLLSKQIKKNSRKFSNHKQAIAVAYSQIKKKYPSCKKQFKY